jgi:hypothetical protein
MHLTAYQEKEVRFFCTTLWMNSSMVERRLVKPMVESLLAGRQVRIFLYPQIECAELESRA